MPIVQNLSLLALRQTVQGAQADPAAKDSESLTALLAQRFVAAGPRFRSALRVSAGRVWKILEIALRGPRWWEQQGSLNATEDQPLRDAIRGFLDSNLANDLGNPEFFTRQESARELRAALVSGSFDDFVDEPELAKEAVALWRDAPADSEQRLAERLAAELRAAGYPYLAQSLAS